MSLVKKNSMQIEHCEKCKGGFCPANIPSIAITDRSVQFMEKGTSSDLVPKNEVIA